ncbi:MAG TPA: PaaI family thioesterase [Burkholderiaceae bacterium]
MEFPIHIPFSQRLGFELLSMADGVAQVAVDVDEAHLNSWSVAHGGVLMTLLDVAMAHAARSIHVDQENFGPGVVTVEMKTSFMRPGEGRLVAEGRLLHRSTTMAFTEGRITDADGKLCAHATGTFKYLKALPGRGRAVKSLRQT